ncbi:hypothetical protein ACFFK0_17540 [Paenibacillus chartarius]|uniref:Uncharacterized protein n=1 Tax=Paenibacillus chartarius TaxID=747481 RepID=A0ABV6DNL0_9BACL
MAYNPQVVEANIVSDNTKNGLFEIVAVLKDRTKCRIGYERTASGEEHATHINRLFTAPCPVCRKDFLCSCMNNFMPTIAEQALQLVKTKA